VGAPVCVDDATRLAYTEVLSTEDGAAATGFVQRAATWFAQLGVRIERVAAQRLAAAAAPGSPTRAR